MGGDEQTSDRARHGELPPPVATVGVLGWLRRNLFSSLFNSALTLIAVYLFAVMVPPIVEWAATSAVASGDSRARCDMGRALSRMGEAMASVGEGRAGRPEAAAALGEVGDQLGRFAGHLAEAGAAAPAALRALVEGRQPAAALKALEAAVAAGDGPAIEAELARLAPLADWGAANDGACWTFIVVWFDQIIYGRYPAGERWRVDLAFLLLIVLAAPLFVRRFPWKGWLGAFLLVVYPVIAFYLFTGGLVGLAVVETTLWGGLFVTLVIAGVGIVASLPIGVVLALGRRSRMPVVRTLSIVFIEVWRGVPLISVLFMASVMFPLFLPEGMNVDKFLRALVGVALFASAYMAEVVRGGLQAIPRGQYEAAQALGLGYARMMALIILPQALRLVIPGIVNTFIGLFKDTTLVLIIGLFDLLGMVQLAATNPRWLGFSIEGYVFAGFGFWLFCFTMSRYSQHVERRLHTGHGS